VALDITFGNMTQDEADRLELACERIDPIAHEAGCTEPWISQLVASFVVASGARTVLETGGFQGATSVYIHDALCRLSGGHLTVCEIDAKRAAGISDRLWKNRPLDPELVTTAVLAVDVLQFLRTTDERFDLAWVDDDHTKPHVTKELMLLIPRMNPGGVILLHDVFGQCDLQEVVRKFGGYSLKLPRLGPAGGLGIIQCP
jgi:predicted O-methyltransferase YrrM